VTGYYKPIVVRGQINERPTRRTYQLFGDWNDQDGVLYIQGTCPINPKDIIVDRIFRRWIVITVGTAAKAMHTIGQIAQIRQIEKADIMYSYYVDTRL
jgi:hypothetical protein